MHTVGKNNDLADLPTFIVDVALQHYLGLGKQLQTGLAATMDQNRSISPSASRPAGWGTLVSVLLQGRGCWSSEDRLLDRLLDLLGQAPAMVNQPTKPTTSEGGTPAALGMHQENATCLFRTNIGFPLV